MKGCLTSERRSKQNKNKHREYKVGKLNSNLHPFTYFSSSTRSKTHRGTREGTHKNKKINRE